MQDAPAVEYSAASLQELYSYRQNARFYTLALDVRHQASLIVARHVSWCVGHSKGSWGAGHECAVCGGCQTMK